LVVAALGPSSEKEQHVSKLKIAAPSVEESIAASEKRRKLLLQRAAGPAAEADKYGAESTLGRDRHGNRAIANLVLGRGAEATNAHLRHVAEYFDHPTDSKWGHQGECDFVAMKLCRAWHLFKGADKLEPATIGRIRDFFLTRDFKSMHPSENHVFLFRTSRYLMGNAFAGETFKAYRRKGSVLAKEDAVWLKRFIRFRARRGWGEFDSGCYISPDWECLTNLYDYAPDAEIKRLAGMMMDLLLADMAVDSLNGMYCGAHGRIYEAHATDHATENTYALQYLYFGNVDPASMQKYQSTIVDALVSDFRPRRIVVDVALNRPKNYINRERKHLHNMSDPLPRKPLAGSIRKLTLYTPHYVLGAVQFQDPYPPGLKSGGYAHHEQHEWDLSFGTRTRARLFTHHPDDSGRPEHGYWTGDLGCRCVSTFQHKAAVLALYDIPAKQPCQFIHAYVPRDDFDEVVEENGWIFVREGKACAALRMLGGHEWTASGKWRNVEVISPGSKNAAVCEAGLLTDFSGFDAFRREIAANTIQFDKKRMRLTYVSKRAGTITMDTKRLREAEGQPVNLDYATYDCPYLQSKWDSGVIVITHDGKREVLDFRDASE
jgi:hypothetical protein